MAPLQSFKQNKTLFVYSTCNELLQMKNNCLFFLLLVLTFSPLAILAQNNKVTISGYVKDTKNGEAMNGVSISAASKKYATVSNAYGFYSLTLPADTYEIIFSYTGYTSFSLMVPLTANQTQNVEMQENKKVLEEVVVNAKRKDANVKQKDMSAIRLDINAIRKIPALLGEVDIVRGIQLLPGVTTVGEGSGGFNVRGGNVDQNLVLLDEAPVFNTSHLFGFFSIFNPDAVKDVKLVKGGIPVQYGGRLSSLLDIRMKEGNSKKLAVTGGIGTIFSRLAVEGPLLKNKASFIVAARRSYIDVLAKPFLTGDLKDSKFNFYDLTAKFNYKANNKNTFFVSGYFGRDVFGSGFGFNWGNTTATARWNHIFNQKIFLNLTAFYSNYDYKLAFKDVEKDQGFDWNAKIKNISLKPDFTYYINTANTLHFGIQVLQQIFEPGNAVITSDGSKNNISLANKYSRESSVYLSNEQKFSDKFSAEYGLRYSYYQYLGSGEAYTLGDTTAPDLRKPIVATTTYAKGKTIASYGNLEPRISFKYEVNDQTSIKASYNRMAQYLHLVSNTAAPSPLDIWTPSSNNIKPQLADQIALGLFKNFKDNTYETSFEIYYKKLQQQLDYVKNADLLLNKKLDADLLQGDGRAWGAELFVRKIQGLLNGWVSYTYSKTERKTIGISNGQWYPARYDRPHVLNIVANYDWNKKWSFSASFVFQSGTPGTFPTNRVDVQGYAVPYNATDTRNNFRIAPYHRLDLSATLTPWRNANRKFKSNWVFSIYNVYNRRNPYSVYFRSNKDDRLQTEAIRFSVVGSFVPAVTYNFNF
jgi:hypothetical protein